jgi:drug/metabolite transporter (DMT)-like permease
VLTGTEAVFDKQVILHSNQQLAFISWSIFGFIFSLLFVMMRKEKLKVSIPTIDLQQLLLYLALGICTLVMILSTNYAFSQMPVTEALSLFQLSMLVSVFFGYRFFQERGIIKKLTGAIIMLAGSLLIILMK